MVAVLCLDGAARAQPTSTEARYAEEIFQQAKKEMSAGHVAEACATLEAVWRIDRGGGTLLALALCHEKEGRGATAIDEFREARALANKASRDDRVRLVDEHLGKLEGSVSRLVVVTERAQVPGLTVELDGASLDPGRWNSAVPIDAGPHVVRALAPGQPPWEMRLQVASMGEQPRVELPPWTMPIPAASPTFHAQTSADGTDGRRIGALALGGIGLVGVAIGSYFGIRAMDQRSEALAQCHGTTRCMDLASYARATHLDAQSSTSGLVSTIAFGVGIGALAGTVVLVVVGKPAAPPSVLGVTASAVAGGALASAWAKF
ncbi:MAG: hypothetical protein JOZ69_15655 [Myxococcales bacterium]|nr:hypothetical protein [Myxococcales bacterium]